MPALRESPRETDSGVLAQTRVWQAPDVRSHTRIVLSENTLSLAALIAGEGETEINFDTIQRAGLDLLTNSLTLEMTAKSEATVVEFASQSAADACFTKLWRRLGPRVRLVPCKQDFWAIAKVPVLVLCIVLIFTLALAMTANGLEQMAEARTAGVPASPVMATLESLLGGVSWEVICGVGGVAAALVQVWLYRRVTEPPARLELVRV